MQAVLDASREFLIALTSGRDRLRKCSCGSPELITQLCGENGAVILEKMSVLGSPEAVAADAEVWHTVFNRHRMVQIRNPVTLGDRAFVVYTRLKQLPSLSWQVIGVSANDHDADKALRRSWVDQIVRLASS